MATPGTTSLGALDDVGAVADLCAAHGARLHVDAAYGGFFALLADGGEPAVDARRRSGRSRGADSVVVDPHKHGLQPYGCGCVLFADPGVARFYLHDSPYTYFSSRDLHPGETTLECSRAGRGRGRAVGDAARAAADARRASARHLAGARAAGARARRRAARRPGSSSCVEPELDIVCVFAARRRRPPRSREAAERAFATLARVGLARREAARRHRVAAALAPVGRGRRTDDDRPPPLPDQAGAPRRDRRAGRPAESSLPLRREPPD